MCLHWWFYSASAHWPEALPYIDLALVLFFLCFVFYLYMYVDYFHRCVAAVSDVMQHKTQEE